MPSGSQPKRYIDFDQVLRAGLGAAYVVKGGSRRSAQIHLQQGGPQVGSLFPELGSMMTFTHWLAGAFTALALIAPYAEGEDARASVAASCSECHGVTGNSSNPRYPNLAGQAREYLIAQLKSFRDKSRRDPDAHAFMWAIGKSLTDDQVTQLAEYFSSQKPAPGRPANVELAAKGKEIFERGIRSKSVPACAFCHGNRGQGTAQIPRLAGQHAAYLEAQIKLFHLDYRPGFAFTMKAVVERLSDDEARQVAAYIQGL